MRSRTTGERRDGHSDGFTLIELMIVVAIIAIIAAIAIPNLLSARLNANEASAIAMMRSLATAQSQFQSTARADVDYDGAGEFGMLRELSGAMGVRDNTDGSSLAAPLRPPALSGSFRVMNTDGVVTRSGYHYRMYLPGTGGIAVNEAPTGAFTGDVETDEAELTWCAYAWPANHNNSGTRSFFVNQLNNITYANDPDYTAALFLTSAPAGAAFEPGGAANSITGEVAIGTQGRDGNIWLQVN